MCFALKLCNLETLKLALGAVAQLGERLVCNQEATGSIPVSSTKITGEIARRLSYGARWSGVVPDYGGRCNAADRIRARDPVLRVSHWGKRYPSTSGSK